MVSPAATLVNEPLDHPAVPVDAASSTETPSASSSQVLDPSQLTQPLSPAETIAHSTSSNDHKTDLSPKSSNSPIVVRWEAEDPENPYNWSPRKTWLIIISQAMGLLCVAFGSSVYSGAIHPMLVKFQVSTEVITLGLSLYVLGFAVGPLLFAPASEFFGRRPVFIATYGPFFVFHIGSALAQNIETLIICRFFAGFFGSAPMTNSGGVISDTTTAETRALAMAMFSLAPSLGPVFGPIVGGYIGQTVSWRWVFWVETIFAGFLFAAGCFVPETYGPVLLRRRAAALTASTGELHVSHYDLTSEGEVSTASFNDRLKKGMSTPFVLLFKEPIVLFFAIYVAVVYGILYMSFGGLPIVFQQERGWKSGPSGLAFLGMGFGMVAGNLAIGAINKSYVRKLHAAGGHLPPEARLTAGKMGGIILPAGLFWLAWTVQPSVHFIVPILATVPFGFGFSWIFFASFTYMVDAYTLHAASALAANSVLRSIFGAAFPLFTPKMFHNLGSNWALTLVAFISLACAPIPFVFDRYGAVIRAKSRFAPGGQEKNEEEAVAEEREEASKVGEAKV